MKINIEEVEASLRRVGVQANITATIIKELTEIVREEKDNKVETPKQKNEFLIVLSDPNNELQGKELVGWVITQTQGQDAGLALEKLKQSGRETNEAKKRKRNMIEKMADIFYSAKRSFVKSKGLAIKTREPVRILITDGNI